MSEENKKLPWQTGKKIKLSANHLILQDPRDYEFNEINQEYGSRLFWQYVIIIVEQWPQVRDAIEDFKKAFDRKENSLLEGKHLDKISDVAGVISKVLPGIFPWENIKDLAGILLSGYTVTANDKKFTAGDSGFCDMSNDPFEVYNALFYSMAVNWQPYFSPLLGEALEDSTRVSEPEPKQSEAEEN